MLLNYLGLALIIIGGIGFLIASFRTGISWGIGCLLFYPISIVFLILHWDVAKNPFLLQLLGIGVVLLAVMLELPH